MQEPNKNTNALYSNFYRLVSVLAIPFLIIAFKFLDTPPTPSGWYQQFMPNLNGQSISDVTFTDSLTGWAVTGINAPGHVNYILKTTNSGDVWNIVFSDTCFFSKVKFANSYTGYACGGTGGGYALLYKSTNGGVNWLRIFNTGAAEFIDMSVLNSDTLWTVDNDGLVGGVFRTTNGGASWTQQTAPPSDHIYMYSWNLGFISQDATHYLRRTTNGGASWSLVSGADGLDWGYFMDTLNGWKSNGNMERTTNGGLNWTIQVLPQGGNIQQSGSRQFSTYSRDTIWTCGGRILWNGNQARDILFRTTNGGQNWLFQIPDTTMPWRDLYFLSFVNRASGWSYAHTPVGIHTINGGDSIWYTGIQRISTEVPKHFVLNQNYPNPFNPRTLIRYELGAVGYVKLCVCDITGKHVIDLVNQKQSAGVYQVDFSGLGFSSGVYFYNISITTGKEVYSDTKKMILIK